MPNFNPQNLVPAQHPDDEDTEAVQHGWRAAELDGYELVDDDFIVNDPNNDLDERPVVD